MGLRLLQKKRRLVDSDGLVGRLDLLAARTRRRLDELSEIKRAVLSGEQSRGLDLETFGFVTCPCIDQHRQQARYRQQARKKALLAGEPLPEFLRGRLQDVRIGSGRAGRLAPVHHADDRGHPLSPMRAQGSRSLTKVVDLSLASAGALRVGRHLERIQLNHVVADLTLHVHATSGLETLAHDSGNVLEPPAHMRLEGRGLKVGERTVNPVLDRRDAKHPVEVGVALQ